MARQLVAGRLAFPRAFSRCFVSLYSCSLGYLFFVPDTTPPRRASVIVRSLRTTSTRFFCPCCFRFFLCFNSGAIGPFATCACIIFLTGLLRQLPVGRFEWLGRGVSDNVSLRKASPICLSRALLGGSYGLVFFLAVILRRTVCKSVEGKSYLKRQP